jgi:hypothetical protein
MNIKGYKTLLNASFSGATPAERLINLLSAIRNKLFAENSDSVAVWITSHSNDEIQGALVYLCPDGSGQKPENNRGDKKANKKETKPPRAAHTIEISIPSADEPKIAGYLHFSATPPPTSEDWLEPIEGLVGKMLLELKREKTEVIIYDILNSYRDQMFKDNKPIGRKHLNELVKSVAEAFACQSIWMMLYDFDNWRNPHGKSLVAFQGHHPSFENKQKVFHQLIKKEIYELLKDELLKQNKGNLKSIGRKIQLPERSDELSEQRFFIAVAPLALPKKSDNSAEIPYIAVVVADEPEHRLDTQDKNLLKKFVLEI